VRFRGRLGVHLAAVALLLLGALAGCGRGGDSGDSDEPAVVWKDLEVDGQGRRYRLYTPPAFDDERPLPLVIALHGSENTVQSFVDATELDEAADTHQFVVAYPEAIRLLWNGGFCCTAGRGTPAADLRFLDQLIDDVAGARRVDRARVYATGVSGGGVMAYRLACDLSTKVAGVASVSGAMTLDDCQPSRPVSVMEIHGTGDGIVPFDGGPIRGAAVAPAPPAMAIAERWASLNGCPGPAATTVEGLVRTWTSSGCAGQTRVRLVAVEGGSHNWFSKVYGVPNGAIDATEAVVEFFELGRRR
jgi:polyhydroxybutyrate depolymerase